MKPINWNKCRDAPEKHHYDVYRGNRLIADTWAVSPEKACTNIWWKYYKDNDQMTATYVRPYDLTAVERG